MIKWIVRKKAVRTIIIIGSLLLGANLSFAENPTQLRRITHKIENIQASLSKDQSKRTHLQQNLANAEISANNTQQKLQRLTKQLNIQKAVLSHLQKNTDQYEVTLKSQQKILADQIKSAYMLGREPYIKLLLNQKDPSELSRVLTYYSYISKQRITAIQALQNTLTQIQINQQKMQQQLHVLKKLKNHKLTENQRLAIEKKNRQRLINIINHQIKTKHQRLNALLINKHHLERTIRRLERVAAIAHINHQNFNRLRGKLRWPTRGQLLNRFGSRIEQSQIHSNSVLIKARVDQPVHAIADGTVVFAKWLPGYGLLLIVSHGKGYMTLYGRNHILYKKPGDIVHAGDIIASVGRTGGYKKPALYFAIRHNARPLNPAHWCKRPALG